MHIKGKKIVFIIKIIIEVFYLEILIDLIFLHYCGIGKIIKIRRTTRSIVDLFIQFEISHSLIFLGKITEVKVKSFNEDKAPIVKWEENGTIVVKNATKQNVILKLTSIKSFFGLHK